MGWGRFLLSMSPILLHLSGFRGVLVAMASVQPWFFGTDMRIW